MDRYRIFCKYKKDIKNHERTSVSKYFLDNYIIPTENLSN